MGKLQVDLKEMDEEKQESRSWPWAERGALAPAIPRPTPLAPGAPCALSSAPPHHPGLQKK